MDDILKAFIALAVDQLGHDHRLINSLSWDELVATMKAAPYSESRGNSLSRKDNFVRNQISWFKFSGSPNDAVLRQVWYNSPALRV